jgi:hypothetical protein
MPFQIFPVVPTTAAPTVVLAFFFTLCVVAVAPRPRPLLQRQQLLHRVALNKQHVPVLRRGRIVAHKTAYFGTVFVGRPNPQPFDVLFDTGSGHVVLPSENCTSDACKKHRLYRRALSASAKEIADVDQHVDDANMTQPPDQMDLHYGTGQVSGELLEEVLCLAKEAQDTETSDGCTRLRIVLASTLTADPFEHFSFDGVVGLGLESLAMHSAFSFFGNLAEAGHLPEPCFSVFLSKSEGADRSEIAFGGHNEELAASAFHWAPVVVPERGYWQVALRGVRIGDAPLSLCGGGACRAVLDTGTSMLGVPEQALSHMHRLLARLAEPTSDCRQLPGPPIVFDLEGFELQLNAEDYSRPAPMTVKSKSGNASYTVCRSSLLPVPADTDEEEGGNMAQLFVFGEPFLQKYYTKYDWRKHRISFSLARQDKDTEAASPLQTV